MGLAQSHAAFFQPAHPNDDDEGDDGIDPLALLYKVERKLWRNEPAWLKPPPRSQRVRVGGRPTSNSNQCEATSDVSIKSATTTAAVPEIDPMGPMSSSQALMLIPTLMDEKWVAPLVALIDSMDAIIQTTGLALLASIIRSDAAETIFVNVGGVSKLIELLDAESLNVSYLALEVVHAICSRNAKITPKFCNLGLVKHLIRLASLTDQDPTNSGVILAALKVFRHVLAFDPSLPSNEPPASMSLLLKLTRSSVLPVSKMAVVCVGLSLSDSANMKKIVEMRCVDALLKLVPPPNPNPCAPVQALSLIAEEDPGLFPKELTLSTIAKILDTLRGGAKRSRTASACAYLFASLSKSTILRAGLCSIANLSILSKLLVGGSLDVLKASAFAIGMAAHEGSSITKEALFDVDAPDNLLKLLDGGLDQDLTRLVVFAIASILDLPVVLRCGRRYRWLKRDEWPKSLRQKMVGLSNSIITVGERFDTAVRLAVNDISCASTFAMKIVFGTCANIEIRRRITTELVLQVDRSMVNGAPMLLSWVLLFFIECSSRVDAAVDLSAQFCEVIGSVDSQLDDFVRLFDEHEPHHLAGLLTALQNFSSQSRELRTVLSSSQVIAHTLSLLTRAKETPIHVEAVAFLNEITSAKNEVAVTNTFAQSPDRIANFSYAQDQQLLLPTLNIMRRLFKRHNHPEMPSAGVRRQLALLLSSESVVQAVAAARVWGNLLLHHDKRIAFALIPSAVEWLLRLIRRCHEMINTESERIPEQVKSCRVAIRSLARGVRDCAEMRNETAGAASFLVVFDLFDDSDEGVMRNAVLAATDIAATLTTRKYMLVPSVLQKLAILIGNRDLMNISPVYRVSWLRFVSALSRRDPATQHMLSEFRVVDAILLLVQSPAASLDLDVLSECLDALAWLSSCDVNVQKKIASTPKLIDLCLKYIDCPRDALIESCLHLLQRLTGTEDCAEEKTRIRLAGGGGIIMRAFQSAAWTNVTLATRACAVVRNLVTSDDLNKSEFQRLGFNSAAVRLITRRDVVHGNLKLQVRGLQALAAICFGMTSAAKASKRETMECESADELLRLLDKHKEPKLCLAWCEALLNLTLGSPQNQKKLVDNKLTLTVVRLLVSKHSPASRLPVSAARLLACMASLPENRSVMMSEGGDAMLSGIITGLQSDVHEVQRFVALLIAHLATRNDSSKVLMGAGTTIGCLVDRLSSKQVNVVENVLQAIMKLGTHAGNKVKFGSRVCFEKMLSLVHHDELAIRKSAVSAIAVLIEGNEVNKKFLLQCEASVITEICSLMKSQNGKIVESAMLILGELSQMADQTLEISKFIDIVGIVRMIEHVNPRIRRAALYTVLNLTKESFNKLRFGIQECVDAMLNCLQSEDMLIVELAMTCLANLSFLDTNALKIAKCSGSIGVLLKLAAASTASSDYLSWNEARSLGLGRVSRPERLSPSKLPPSPSKTNPISTATIADIEEVEEDEIDDKLEPFVYSSLPVMSPDHGSRGADIQQLLDFSSFPTRQTSVLEQTLLVLSNSAEAYHLEYAVEKVAIKVISQSLSHPSELVKRCGCYILAVWCKKDTKNQRCTTKQGILPVLIQLLNSPNLNVVEAAIFLLGKLAYYGDNHVKLLQLDLLTTIVQTILRKPMNLTHEGLLDRTIRLLGTLVRFPRVRQTIKSEEIIADILTQLLQVHRQLAKNASRLILAMLEEDSLRFFLPKKTVTILRIFLTDHHGASPKTIRNILRVFQRIATVEEHKTTIALEDSGEALTCLVQELRSIDARCDPNDDDLTLSDLPANASTVLSLLACISSSRKIALILHEKDVYTAISRYVGTKCSSIGNQEPEEANNGAEPVRHLFGTREMLRDALIVARSMCSFLGDRAGSRLSKENFSCRIFDALRFLQSATELDALLPEYLECFTILERLSGYSRDLQYFAETSASEVVLMCIQQWMRAAEQDGTVEGRSNLLQEELIIDLVGYITPIIGLTLRMAQSDANKGILVRSGGIPLLLRCLHIALLTDELRLQLIHALRLMCSLGISSEWFDSQDLVMPLFQFMYMHRHHFELRLNCLACLADILETSVLSRRHVIGQPQVLKFLLECLQNAGDEPADQVHFAINALECMSMEPELAKIMSQLQDSLLELVSTLLLIPDEAIARSTQYFAIEMIGYMASYGYSDKLGLDAVKINRILRFLDFAKDETITGEVIALVIWTLAHLVREHPSSATATHVCSDIARWIAQTEEGVDLVILSGLTPSDQLGTSSTVAANTLTILLAVCASKSATATIRGTLHRHKQIRTNLSIHLEAVEREVHLPALRLLAIYMVPPIQDVVTSPNGSQSSPESEDWSMILRHLMEWMEVYARDPERCPSSALCDAFTCLGQITTIERLGGEFRASINRSGLAEIVANTITYLGPKLRASEGELAESDIVYVEQDEGHRLTLINALKTCANLMELTPLYVERFFLLNVPHGIEVALMISDDEIIIECLTCMSLLADWSSSRQLLFSSLQCVTRLVDLLPHKDVYIVSRITSLLVILCSRITSLPGLCTTEGIRILCERLTQVADWSCRDRYTARVTEDCATILLSVYSTEESVTVIFDDVDVVGKMFEIVVNKEAAEIPLRILTKVSSNIHSHGQLLRLLPRMCRLLDGTSQQLSGTPHHLVLCILFNLFCRSDDAEAMEGTLMTGQGPLLQQLFPLSRWVSVSNAASVRIAIKLIHTYVSSSNFRGLLNDGKNIPALLNLVADSNDDVAGAAAQLLLTAIKERAVEIAVTVEDGIAVLVRTLQKTSKWHLQCLLLAILRNMCHDAEVPVLIMKEDGVNRLVHFVRERKGALFAADERLAHSCKILRYISAVTAPGSASRIVEARGHIRLIELFTHQESATNDSDRATTMEILSNISASGEVSGQLAESKLHDHCLKWVISQRSASEQNDSTTSQSRKLALYGLRTMSKYSKSARQDVVAGASSKYQLIGQLEKWLSILQFGSKNDWNVGGVTANALAVLMYLSKSHQGRQIIYTHSSVHFVERICGVILAVQENIDISNSDVTQAQYLSQRTTSVLGVKLLGNVLNDLSPERFRVTWKYDALVKLLPLLQTMLADHQHSKLQLHTLNVLRGSYVGELYFPVPTQMLSDLFNLLLISPTPHHAQQAERIIVNAFERQEQIQPAIAGTQILEQLLIVFSQRVESQQLQPQQARPLAPALTQVLNVSRARGLVINPRFTSKIVTLLTTSSMALKAEANSSSNGPRFGFPSNAYSDDDDEDALTAALAVYLGFVFRTTQAPPGTANCDALSPYQQSIRDAIRSEVNSTALAALIMLLLSVHEQVCTSLTVSSSSSGSASPRDQASEVLSERSTVIGPRSLSQPDLLVLNLVSQCLHVDKEEAQQLHIDSLLREVPHLQWVCMLRDIFSELRSLCVTTAESDRTSSGNFTSSDMCAAEGMIQVLKMLSVVARTSPSGTDFVEYRRDLCRWCLQSIRFAAVGKFKTKTSLSMLAEALRGLTSILTGWGEDVIVQSFLHFAGVSELICDWLDIFKDPNPLLSEPRSTTLQLLLLLVSSGARIDEFKAAGVRGAIENNELIETGHKSVAISILSLLGYNADLNAEFQLAIRRFEQAEAFTQRKEALSYLTNFLQLYTLTNEALQEVAIDQCMRRLVDDVDIITHESNEPNGGSSDQVMSCIHDYIVCLGKLAQARNFVDLYMRQWNTNALLAVCFSRRRALNRGGLKECTVLSLGQISAGLDICVKISDSLSALTSAGTLSDTTFFNAMVLLDDLPPEEMPLCERVISLLAWSVDNEDTFDLLCNFASRLRSILRCVPSLSDNGVQSLVVILDALTKNVPDIELLGELLTELLTCMYRNATKLKNSVRERMLLYILMILKRMGEDDLSACSIYEQSIQVILANVHAPAEPPARCSWDLLGVLTELDPAIVTIFNFDGIQIILKAFCGPTSAALNQQVKGSQPSTSPAKRVLSTRKSALSAADRAALVASSSAASEAAYRRLEALKCLSKAARNHDEVLQKIGETQGIGAHLFRILAGSMVGMGNVEADATPAVNGAAQEHAAHLIARISSMELFRASLLSQDHVSTLIEALESVHPKIVLHALEALFYLSEFAMCLDALVRHATVPVLAQILVAPIVEQSNPMQQNTELFVLGLLANMCVKSKVVGRRVVSSNLLPRLRAYLASARPQIQFYAIWVVKSVSKDSELVAKLHEQRIAEVIVDKLAVYEPLKTQRKAFGALCNMISGYRMGTVFVDDDTLRRLIRTVVQAMHPLVVSSQPTAHRSLARGLSVLEAMASLSQQGKEMLCDDDDDDVDTRAIPIVLQLLDSIHSDVKLKALRVIAHWVEDNADSEKLRRMLLAEAPLLSLVRAISDEKGESLLVALTLLNTLLAIDEELKSKLSAMTNELLLRLLPTLVPTNIPGSHPLAPVQLRALNEALKSLVTMTRSVTSGGNGNLSLTANYTAAIENAIDPLVELLRLSSASDNLRLNTIYLLVNFAGSSIELRPKMLLNGTMAACIRMLNEPHDDKLLQLCLLGMALLTSNSVDFSCVVPDLVGVVDVLLRCLQSKSASVQANAVWVVSNICGEERLREAIASRGGATTLQTILHETINETTSRTPVTNTNSRPLSSSQRIREYAPKAIKSLGFAPMTTGTSNSDQM